MKRIVMVTLLAFSLLLAQQMNAFCASPPFVGGKNSVVRPNILICQDMTGSMTDQTAEGDYGYANPDYKYAGVNAGGQNFFKMDPLGPYSGFDINQTFMTRIDIARKVLTGGKGTSIHSKDTLLFEVAREWNGYTWHGVITTDSTERSTGAIREIADKDDDFIWDSDAPYFALQQFSTYEDFGTQIKCGFGDSLTEFFRAIETPTPSGYTWVGDAVFEAIHYIRFCPPHFGGYQWLIDEVGTDADPWYDFIGDEPVSVSCRPTFVIVVSDGESNSDNPQTWAGCNHLPKIPSPYGPEYNDFCLYNGPDDMDGTHGCADDYAYYAHIVDLRPDDDPLYGIPNDVAEQTITFYSIFLFASSQGANLSKNIAKYGGFNDANGDKMPGPDATEWDKDGDGDPDNYFYADEGKKLEDAFKEIFVNIMTFSRITSASAGAMTGTTQGLKSGGLAFLAQFYPRRIDLELDLTWIGSIEALWLDPYGWLREETQGRNTLHLKNDYVVDMFYCVNRNRVMAARYRDPLGLGDAAFFELIDTIPAESLNFVWDGSERLTNRDYDDRTIYTNLGGLTPFGPGDNSIDPHLDYGNESQCDSLIDYIRGLDYPGTDYRSRQFFGNVWKLGDIIYSSPLAIGAPTEAYHMIYADTTYYDFWNKYRDRRTVVYAGANDGMLHAFNSGSVTTSEDRIEVLEIDGLEKELGTELWAHIPYNVLPHLKWLKDTSYCHVYYCDLRPYATEAQIFLPDEDHPYGWGTILVSGLRFGGSEIALEGQGIYRSSYSCFDITNPENTVDYPRLLWEFTDEYLGYTVCVPVCVKITDRDAGNKWYLLFGSGPQSLYAECTQNARVYVVDPLTGEIVHTIVIPDDNTAITNIFSADWGLDYTVDLIYFGTYDNAGGGKIYRINTQQNTDPTTWTLHQVIDLDRPITAEGSIAIDPRGNIWIYFGTGKYLSNLDVADATVQLFIGLKDDTTKGTPAFPAFTLADLLDVTDVSVFADSVGGMAGVSNFEDIVAEVSARAGWYRRFTEMPGERVINTPLVFSGAIVFTTFIPSDTTDMTQGLDLCLGGGAGPQSGNLWALYYLTGTAYKHAMLDINQEGERLTHVPVVGDMPSEPAWFLEKLFVQTGGSFGRTEYQSPYNPYGGIMLWRGR